MAITSENKKNKLIQYQSSHFRYAIIYVIVTSLVLLFLNIYSSERSKELFYKSKEASMIERCLLAASDIASLEVLNEGTVANAVKEMGSLRATRMVITDQEGVILYDSDASALLRQQCDFPEVKKALENYDVFRWNYRDGAMQSRAATPIISYGTMIGCVYIMEHDTAQGALIQSLQINTLMITLILEVFLILFSLVFSRLYTVRVRRIMSSMRIIREGDYSHKVKMGGSDELTVLGNEFNDLTERLYASEQRRSQFVSDASHELKTPLASIKLLSDSILQNDMDMDTVREFVSDIGNEADRLNRMSEKLLSLSRLDTQEQPEYEIIYMAPTVEKVCRMLSLIAKENDVFLSLSIEQDSPVLILEDDLYQIVFNLVENGIKYNVRGGKLSITLSREDDNAVLSVADTGVGIPEDSLLQIFERFYRVDKARSRRSGGSGLGLSIVRSIVKRNKGEITAQSTVGSGSVFTVSFPVFDTEDML